MQKKLLDDITNYLRDYVPTKECVRRGARLLRRCDGDTFFYSRASQSPMQYSDQIFSRLKMWQKRGAAECSCAATDAATEDDRVPLNRNRGRSRTPEVTDVQMRLGWRADHYELPEEIQKIVSENYARRQTIRSLHERAKMLTEAGVDKEKIKPLVAEMEALDDLCREQWKIYDLYENS